LIAVPFEEGDKTFKLFLTAELKATTNKSIRISPHQVAFHLRHLDAPSFIVVLYIDVKDRGLQDLIYLYHGKQVKDLMVMGLDTPPLFKCLRTRMDWPLFEVRMLDAVYSV